MSTATSQQKEVVQQPDISPVYLDPLQICHDTGRCGRPLLYGARIEMGGREGSGEGGEDGNPAMTWINLARQSSGAS